MHTLIRVAFLALICLRPVTVAVADGPWDMTALRKPPQATWGEAVYSPVKRNGAGNSRPSSPKAGESVGLVRPVFYEGQPLNGKPTRVFAYYGRPAAGEGPFPAVLLVHGGGGHAFPDWADYWARRGYAALAMDTGGCGPGEKHRSDGGPEATDEVKFRNFAESEAREEWTYHAVAAVIRGHSLLAARKEVDAQRIAITGISWGGYLTCIVAGLDDRLKAAVPVYGCGFIHENSVWAPNNFKSMSPSQRNRWVENFDPSRYLASVKCPMLFVGGMCDFAYPPDSYRKSFRLVPAAVTLSVLTDRPHGHIWSFKEVDAFIDHHLNGGAALPQLGSMKMAGDVVSATVTSPSPVAKATLNYTTDSGPWQKRCWQTAAAQVSDGKVTARLPFDRPLVCYLQIWDDRGLPITTAYEELGDPPVPISLHPDNPHYLLFRGRPTLLIGSTEHYGAVLNLDFDYVRYLDELKAEGLNLTRTFSGVYCEDDQSFQIKHNTLAPARGRLIAPWARSTMPGNADGGNKFDLDRWDEAYFRRLKDFLTQAGRRGIVVEMVLFCPFYEDRMWNLSPMNARNNVRGLGAMPRTEVWTLKHPEMLALHEALVARICAELKDCDNLYYEVCNEPYFGGVTQAWQDRIVAAIAAAEAQFPHRHLIAQNIANGRQKIDRSNPAVAIFNFHYATPPDTVAMNYGLKRVIADDETGFRGSQDYVYRQEGWEFILAGGAIYDNLDYSFCVGHEDGSARPDAPGGGSAALRRQLAVLRQFLHGFEFVRMKPDLAAIKDNAITKMSIHALSEPGRQYALYLRGDGLKKLAIDLPAGAYLFQWTNTQSGPIGKPEILSHTGGVRTMEVPEYRADIALGFQAQP
ncbi:MAG: alpha/beta hydrolase family protein [Thermoguttaceae bacterium]